MSGLRPATRDTSPSNARLVILPPVLRGDIPALCERLREIIITTQSPVVVCDVDAIIQHDLAVIDALARLHLTARREHSSMRLERARPGLMLLLSLTGLGALILHGQAEEGEDPLDIEEIVYPGDPAV